MTRQLLIDSFGELARHCAAFWREQGIDLAGYTTAESADDLEALRRALVVEKLNLWGISYGTHLAFAALRRHPNRFHRAVLASAEGPDDTVKLPSRTQDFLERVGELVRRDPGVAAAVPDLVALMDRVLRRLGESPARVSTRDPRTGEPLELTISLPEVQVITGFLIKNPDSLTNLPLLYWAMDQGDFSGILPIVLQLRGLQGMRGMPEIMDAASGISAPRRARVERERRWCLLDDMLNFPGPHLAQGLGVPPLPDAFRAPLSSDVPALFLTGTLDGRTYPEAHRELAAGFSSAVHLFIEGAGHDLFMSSPEVETRILDFLARGTTSADPIRLPPPRFTPIPAP